MKPSEFLLTKKEEIKLKEHLMEAEKRGRIQITEWRNFMDLDLQPYIKKNFISKTLHEKEIEEWNKTVKDLCDVIGKREKKLLDLEEKYDDLFSRCRVRIK